MASKAVAKRTTKAPVNAFTFTEDQVELIKSTLAVGATDDELKLFLYQAQRTGLDPMARQIYFVKRQGRMTIQTSIDGLRVVAERSGKYSGQDAPVFIEKPPSKFPVACTVTVYKLDAANNRVGVPATAYWDEYKPASGQDFMWNKMPHTMLSKVAEALALRKAFPQDLSGIYSEDEMTQAKSAEEVKPSPQVEPKQIEYRGDEELTPKQMAEKMEEQENDPDPEWIRGKQEAEMAETVEEETEPEKPVYQGEPDLAKVPQRKMFFALAHELGYDEETIKERVKAKYGLKSFTNITTSQLSEAIDALLQVQEKREKERAEKIKADETLTEDAPSDLKIAVAQRISKGEITFEHSNVWGLTKGEALELLARPANNEAN